MGFFFFSRTCFPCEIETVNSFFLFFFLELDSPLFPPLLPVSLSFSLGGGRVLPFSFFSSSKIREMEIDHFSPFFLWVTYSLSKRRALSPLLFPFFSPWSCLGVFPLPLFFFFFGILSSPFPPARGRELF